MTEDGEKPQDIFELIDRQFKELPIHKRFQKLENLISDEICDALTDLTEEEINMVAIYKGLVKYFGGLETFDFVIDKKLSLMRSRDRLGRQEYLQGLKETKEVLIPPQPIPHRLEEEQKTTTPQQKVSWIRRLFSRGRER